MALRLRKSVDFTGCWQRHYRSRVVTPMRAKIMKITYTDSRDGMVLIGFTDERGEHEIALSTIETADLIGALRTSLEEAVGSPAANSMGLPGIERVQIVETAEEVFFRVYMNDRISHDYPVPKGTVLADELPRRCASFGAQHVRAQTGLGIE